MIGYVDRIGMNAIVGWAETALDGPRAVKALFRGKTIGSATASAARPDVAMVTRGNPNCGFVIEIEPPYDVDEIHVVVDDKILPKAQQPAEHDTDDASGWCDRPLRMTIPRSTPRDIEICQRLIATYGRLLSEEDPEFAGDESMWTRLLRLNYRNLASVVARGSAQELCDYLLYIHKRPETWGISQGPESYYLLRNALAGSAAHKTHAALYSKELLRLSEYLGIIPVENAEQGATYDAVDHAAIVRAIGRKIGIDPIFPHAVGGLFCLDTGAGLVQQRDTWALYGALRIASLLSQLSTKRVCEIGGGLGQLCHYVRLLGVRQYVLIDLPHVSLLQAFLLMRANPESRIALFDGGAFDADAEICVYPTFMYQRAPDLHFDLTVNVDSMPEMGWDNALSYARAAACKSAAFLSINQEAKGPLGITGARQISVAEVFTAVPCFRQSYRFPSWVRRGYVESYYVGEPARVKSGATCAAGDAPVGTVPRADEDNYTRSQSEIAPQVSAREVPSAREELFEGYLDTVGPEMIAGWARNIDAAKPVEVEVLVDDCVIARTTADSFSAGLKRAGIGSGHHAFAVRAPVALFDGKQHQVGVRITGMNFHLRQSPRNVQLPTIVKLGPTIAHSLTAEPWIIDGVSLNGSELVLAGWAIPPRDRPDDAAFFINGARFDWVDWPQPRHDIHQLYFYHPHASHSGFRLRADLSKILASGATDLVMRYGRASGDPIAQGHDYYLALGTGSDLPLPDALRRKRVSGTTDPYLFQLGGYTLLRKIDSLLTQRYATSTDEIGRILDWGCGCGRLLRYLVARGGRSGTLFGVDIDADNIAWCAANLPSATVKVGPLLPPSPFQSGQFDLIIGNSVFTHLGEPSQLAWLEELDRVLARGGLAIVSVQTITDLSRETFHPAAYERLLHNGFLSEKIDNALVDVIHDDEYYRSAFHTHEYIRSVWAEYFAIEEIIPQFSNNMQDLVIMRKTA